MVKFGNREKFIGNKKNKNEVREPLTSVATVKEFSNKENREGWNTKFVAGMFFIWIATSFYGETESQWFNNYVLSPVVGTGYSNAEMSIMVSTSAIMGTFAFIIWGIVSDNLRTKFGRRVPIYIIGAISTAIFVILFGKFTSLIWLIICDGIIIGLTSNMFHSTSKALIPDLFRKEYRGKINFLMQIGGMIGGGGIWILAFIFKGINGDSKYYTKEQFDIIFSLCATLLILSAIMVFILIKEPEPKNPPKKFIEDLKLIFSVNEMKKHKDFLKLFVASLFVIMSLNSYKPWILKIFEQLVIPKNTIEILIPAIIASIIAGFIFIKFSSIVDKIGRKKPTLFAVIATIVACISLAVSNFNFPILVISLISLVSLSVALNIGIQSWTQDLLPPESRGKFLGIINIGSAGFQVPGVVLAGIVSDHFGQLSIFIVSALYIAISIPIFLKVPETLYRKEYF
ncbi:MAG: MFS transporter [Candidatus Helarchaeota archaeon]